MGSKKGSGGAGDGTPAPLSEAMVVEAPVLPPPSAKGPAPALPADKQAEAAAATMELSPVEVRSRRTAEPTQLGPRGGFRPVKPLVPEDVSVVIIIPVYKHSVLLAEAIESALSQATRREMAVVIVNDGCPHIETDQLCTALSLSRPDLIYLHKKNGGPSSARNFGLDFAADNFPNMQALFFLDSDNRLSPDAIEHACVLLETHPDVGWIYPHITTFEVEWAGDYNIPYSRLLHVVHENLCDTGCLIRAELARKLRFNADAQSGFEDWDFWLSAIQAGYRGMCADLMGFEYRNRAESRFKEVSRDRTAVTNYLRDRYKKFFTPRRLLRYEHEDAPRFLFIDMETLGVNFFSDPQLPWTRTNTQSFFREFWSATREPDKFHIPDVMIWGSEQVLQGLGKLGLAHSLLWLIQRQLKDKQFVVLSLSARPDEIDVQFHEIGKGTAVSDRIVLIATRRDIIAACAQDEGQGWLWSLLEAQAGPSAVEINLRAGVKRTSGLYLARSIINAIATTVQGLRGSAFRTALDQRWNWRDRIFPARHEYPALLERYLKAETLLPRAKEPKRADVAFVVPFGSFGGSEKVGYAAAQELRKLGFNTHLFVIGGKGYKVIPEFATAFDTVNLIGDDVPALWGGSKYGRGTEFGTADDAGLRVPLLKGLLSSMDVVINCQSAPMNAAIGELRAQGIMTISYIHLFDRSSIGRDVGHPFLGLMFEHAYDLFLLCSHALRHQLHGMGIPSQKMLTVENVPSFSIPAERLKTIRHERARTQARTLNVLFIGRMDAQKGLERIAGIVEACSLAKLDVVFRCVGSSIVEGEVSDRIHKALGRANITFEPPIFAADKLTDAFAQADVMILPSRWEGAPLVILEAQQAGCIPIATDVGAVTEQIEHGIDGFIVPNRSDVEVAVDFVTIIAQLSANPGLRSRISLAAIERLQSASWTQSFGALLDVIGKRFPLRKTGLN